MCIQGHLEKGGHEVAAKNSMFEPEDERILRDMYGTDHARVEDTQEMFEPEHESVTGACSETFGTEANSPTLSNTSRRRRSAWAERKVRPEQTRADALAGKSKAATRLLVVGAITMVLTWAIAIASEIGISPLSFLFSERHAENLAPMREAGQYARMDSYFYANDLDIYNQEDEHLKPYAQSVQIYAKRLDFFSAWHDAIQTGNIDAWSMAYDAQQLLSLPQREDILPGNEEQYALACGEISAFLETEAGVSGELLAALVSDDYDIASDASDEVEMLLNHAMAQAFLAEGPGALAQAQSGAEGGQVDG